MSGMSNFLKSAIVDDHFRTSPVYLGLFQTSVSDDGSGTETSYAGYARQVITLGAFNSATQTFSNTAVVSFPDNNGTTVTITHGAVFDATAGGNMLFSGKLTASKVVQNGDSVRVRIGEGVFHFVSVSDD